MSTSSRLGQPVASQVAAWAVHAYTAAGALLAFLALDAVVRGEPARAFWWLAVAMLVDSSDGTVARRLRVKEVLPQFDGSRLDDLVDYLNYVLVPVALMYHGGTFPERAGLAVAAAPLLASAYGFCHREAKTADHFFRGFPSYWNVVAFYLFTLRIEPLAAAAWVVGLSVLVVLPVRFIYPSRTPVLRRVTLALGLVWGALMVICLWELPAPPPYLLWLSLFFPVYYAVLSAWLELVRRLHPGSS